MFRSSLRSNDWIAGLVVFAPISLMAIVSAFRFDWAPHGDIALEIMRSRDVGNHTPLIGAFGRYGWSHPGPAIFFLLSLPSKLSHNPTLTTAIFGVILKWLPLAATFGILKRSQGLFIGSLFAIFGHLFLLNHRDSIWTVWNPTLGLCLFIFVICFVGFAEETKWSATALLVCASILVQFHIGYLLPLLVIVVVAIWKHNQSTYLIGRFFDLKVLTVTIFLILLIWLPSIMDQLFGTQNATEIFQFFTSQSPRPDPTVGLVSSLKIISNQLFPFSAWNGRSDISFLGQASEGNISWLVLSLLLTIILEFISKKITGKNNFSTWLLIALVLVSIPSISQSSVPAYPYLFSWVSALAMCFWLTNFVTASNLLRHYYAHKINPLIKRSLLSIFFITLATLSLLISQKEPPHLFEMRAVRHFEAGALKVLKNQALVGLDFTEYFPGIGFGIALSLELQGSSIHIERPPSQSLVFHERIWGRHRISGPKPSVTIAVARGSQISRMLESSKWSVLDVYDPYSLSQTRDFVNQNSENIVALLTRNN